MCFYKPCAFYFFQNNIDAFPKFINIIISFLKLRQEKFQLEQTLEQEQEFQVNKLMRKIERLEADVVAKQSCLEQVGNV